MGAMNIFTDIFGIFRQRGLVSRIQEGRPLIGFVLLALVFSIIGAGLYGFAMGIGLGLETALKDAAKLGLIALLGMGFTMPIFWVAYRLLGREERPAQVALVPLTLMVSVAIILAVMAPVVFLLSVLIGFNQEAVYVHVIIVDIAVLVGVYLAGTLIYHSFGEHHRLVVPNVVSFLLFAIIVVVLIIFFGPFLTPYSNFSVGVDRLKDGLGIGVAQKANQALEAASSAERIMYRFQATNTNGDLIRDYTVTRVGEDALIQIHLHTIPNESFQQDKLIWILDGLYYTDFEGGRVNQVAREDVSQIIDSALPSVVFDLPPSFDEATWRAHESQGLYTVIGTTSDGERVTLVLGAGGRLSSLRLGRAERGLQAETNLNDIGPGELDRSALEKTLNQAIVLGSVDQMDASMQSYVQDATFFVARYPRNWSAGIWDSVERQVVFEERCLQSNGCASLTLRVYDLAEGKGPEEYARDLAASMGIQPEYRNVRSTTGLIGEETVGIVEYDFDRPIQGRIATTHHVETIFVGAAYRYHLDFSVGETRFEDYRSLFERMAEGFVYLKTSWKD